jgi:hypothetical protein
MTFESPEEKSFTTLERINSLKQDKAKYLDLYDSLPDLILRLDDFFQTEFPDKPAAGYRLVPEFHALVGSSLMEGTPLPDEEVLEATRHQIGVFLDEFETGYNPID